MGLIILIFFVLKIRMWMYLFRCPVQSVKWGIMKPTEMDCRALQKEQIRLWSEEKWNLLLLLATKRATEDTTK
ncbi:hypothetical protein HKD37_11G032721 [Glycine soja]